MAINSMTGFARTEGQSDSFQWAWQIKSVNGRGLDIRCRLPGQMDEIEPDVRKRITKSLSRGSVFVSLELRREGGGETIRINEDILSIYQDLAGSIAENAGVNMARADGLLGLRGVIETADFTQDKAGKSALIKDLIAGLDAALAELNRMRAAEGKELAGVLTDMLQDIASLADKVKDCAAIQPEQLREKLGKKIQDMLAGHDEFDAGRLEQEAALLAVKADVREEIDRLSAHIQAAHDLLEGAGAKGRKLDFLLQEFQRETNTICSKSSDITLTKIGLELKAIIDQVREQVQNIE